MKVIFPGKILVPYVEAYYVSSNLRQDRPNTRFPAISTSYIKFSSTAAVVSGQATKPMGAEIDFGNATGLGVKLRAGAFPALFGIPAHEVTDRVIPLEQLLGNAANELNEQITEAATPTTQIQCFESKFTFFIQRQRDSHPIEQQAVIVLQQLSTAQVAEIAREFGYSARHFQRKLNELVGFSPRLYKRITRFEKALMLIQMSSKYGNLDWSAIAIHCGYSDQAHFIREFRQFAGQTPTVYLSTLQGS